MTVKIKALSKMRPPTIAPAAIPSFAPLERPLEGDDDTEAELGAAGEAAPAQKNDPPTLDSLDNFWKGEQSSGCEL